MRFIFTGTRYPTRQGRQMVVGLLDRKLVEIGGQEMQVSVGDADGIDRFVREWCRKHLPSYSWDMFEARWGMYGRAAGPKRNEEMVEGGGDRGYAFPMIGEPNRGTLGCRDLMESAGIEHQTFWVPARERFDHD